MQRMVRILAALCVVLLPAGAFGQSGVTKVWAVDEGEKVKQTDLNHWAEESPLNPVWDGVSIRVSGARNEIVGFQIILEASGSGATDVNVFLDSLVGPGYVIMNRGGVGDPMNFVGKHIELFTEHYIDVTSRSQWSGSWGWWGARPTPDVDMMGLLPDALVPFEAPNKTPANGVGGAPFAVGSGRVQGVWVDIFIPADAPAGTYSGTVRVTEQGVTRATLPMTLEVFGFSLPDSTHFHTMFVYEGLIERAGVAEGSAEYWRLFHNYMNVFHRHRIDLNLGNQTVEGFQANLQGYFTGDWYGPQFGFAGPGAGIGNQTYGIGVYDQPDNGWASGFWPNDSASWGAAADAWEGWFVQNAPSVVRFKYMTDEPSPSAYPTVMEHARWIRNGKGIGRNLMTYCTVRLDPRLYGAITFWSLMDQSGYDPGDGYVTGYVESLAKPRQALGEKIALYNGTRPAFGQPEALDNHLTDNRVNPWIAFKYDIDQFFLWSMGFITTMSPARNVFVNNYDGPASEAVWGAGQYLYPGKDEIFAGDSRGVDGPIVSMRMKNFRRGMQDYEYLWLARQAGVPEDSITAILTSVVPAALDEVDQGGQPQWAQRGHLYESARLRLAALLDRAPKTDPVPTGTFQVSPPTVPAGGGDVTLSWTSTWAESATLDNGIGAVSLSGNRTVRVTQSTVFHLLLTNSSGSRTLTAEVTVQAATLPSGTLQVSPATVPAGGGDVTLSWTSTGADSARLDQGIGPVPLSGSRTVRVTQSTVFHLLLTNSSGSRTLTAEVTVQAATLPSGTLEVSSSTVPAGGGDVTLSWTSTGADTARLDQGIGPVPLSGSRTVRVTQSTVFNLLLTNSSGSRTLTAEVTVAMVPTAPPGSNLLSNSGFESGLSPWWFHTDTEGTWESATPGYRGGHSCRVEISRPGSNVQLYHAGVIVKPSTAYRLVFYAKSNTKRDLEASLFQHGSPYENYGLDRKRFDLGASWRKFSYEFRTPALGAAVADGRFQFWFASIAQTGDVYHIDDVQLVEIGATVSALPLPPALIAPFMADELLADAMRIRWHSSERAEEYHIQVAQDGDFQTMFVDTVITDTLLKVGSLESGVLYYARVHSHGSAGESDHSDVTEFSLPAPKTVVRGSPLVPREYVLEQNFPNPFNPSTVIRYGVPAPGRAVLRLFDALGREVAVLTDGERTPGYYEVHLDGSKLTSGVYFYHLEAGGEREVRRMVLVK